MKLISALEAPTKSSTPPTLAKPKDFSKKLSIVEAVESPEFFGPLFRAQESWSNWKVFLKTLYGLQMTEAERALAKECTGRESEGKAFREAYAIVGRRGGKSRIASLIVAYESLFGDWRRHLAPGERAYAFLIATDKVQAGVCLAYLKGVFSLFPNMVEKIISDEIVLKNGVTACTKTASFRAGRGFSVFAVVGDEIGFWRDFETSANPASEVIASLIPGLLPEGMLLGLSTPYSRQGFLFEQFEENFGRQDSATLIWRAPTLTMNPTYSQEKINKLLQKDRSVYSSEYLATWREDLESFLSREVIERAMTHGTLRPEPTKRYFAFVDPSGGRSDSMTLAIAHREGEKVVVDRVEEVRPPFDPSTVVEKFAGVLALFQIKEARSDRYAGSWPETAFRKYSVRLEMSNLSASELYLEFGALMNMGRVELVKDDRLLGQLQSLERRTQSGGRELIDHPPYGHDDMANAAAGAVVLAFQQRTWSPEEMEARLPTAIKSERAEQLRCAIRGDDYTEKKRQESAQEEMDEFMRQGGGSPIVR